MGSLVDELRRREAAARAEAERLRGQIAELAERLAGVEERLSRLVIAREVVDEVLDRAASEVSPVPVGFQNSATGPELGFYAARSYSLMRPPRTGRRLIRFRVRSATG